MDEPSCSKITLSNIIDGLCSVGYLNENIQKK